MINAHPFIYGRTRTVDYRWLQPPMLKLRIGFFADALEMCSPLLRKGERCFFICVDEQACIFSTFLSIPGMLDQKGRTISFVFGYTVDQKSARDFAYYLPNMLMNTKKNIEKYIDPVRQAVTSDALVEIPSFALDIIQRSNNDQTLFKQNQISHYEDVQLGPEDFSISPHIATTQSINVSADSSDRWLETTTREIRSRINTPRMISNFDFLQLGPFIEEMSESLNESRGQVAPSSAYEGSIIQESASVPDSLQQMRQFVGKRDPSEASTEKPRSVLRESYGAQKTQTTFKNDESESGFREQPSNDRHSIFDLFFGRKSKPTTKARKDE